jgi:hypothetical protein
MENRGLLADDGGIYFLYSSNNMVLYVGRSANLKPRIMQHIYNHPNKSEYLKTYPIKKISYIIENCIRLRPIVEKIYIYLTNPLYNNNKVQKRYYDSKFQIFADYGPIIGFGTEVQQRFQRALQLMDSDDDDDSIECKRRFDHLTESAQENVLEVVEKFASKAYNNKIVKDQTIEDQKRCSK